MEGEVDTEEALPSSVLERIENLRCSIAAL